MLRWCELHRNAARRSTDHRNTDKRKFANSILNKGVVIMALIVSRAILFLILVLAFGIATVFPEQKLPVYILFTLFVVVAIVSNVWLTHQNVKKHIIKFDKRVAYFWVCSQEYSTLESLFMDQLL